MDTIRSMRAVVMMVAAIGLLAGASQAAPVTVPNAGFEDRATFDPFGDGTHKYPQPSREYWCYYDSDANGGPARIGNPALTGLATAAEGDYVVRVIADPREWVADTFAPNGVATLLTDTFDPSMTYTLTAQVARYVDDSYWAGYLVQLVAGGTKVLGATYAGNVSGGTVIAEDRNTQPVPPAAGDTDEWATSTVVYTPDPADAGLAGLPLQIRLLTLRKPGDPGYPGNGYNDPDQYAQWITYAAFDDVALDAAAAQPEEGFLHIFKFLDIDGDGTQGPNEPLLDPGMFTFIITDPTGQQIEVPNCEEILLPPGIYTGQEISWGDWHPTTPDPFEFEIVPGQTTEIFVGNAVPEPATMGLLGLAACGLGGYVRRRRTA